jgi:Na+/glutamate symporter
VVGGLILIAAITRGGRPTLAACRDSLADSAKSALTVGMACAIVGTIIGMMTQTGVGTIFGSWIIGLGAKACSRTDHDHAAVDPARHRHPDHSDLHHHRRARRAGAVKLGCP